MAQFERNFEWDPQKAALNIRKHGVSFERAASIFQDPEALTIYDRGHSQQEDRWITMGMDNLGSILIVCHVWREVDERGTLCRIVSARKATQNEVQQYRNR